MNNMVDCYTNGYGAYVKAVDKVIRISRNKILQMKENSQQPANLRRELLVARVLEKAKEARRSSEPNVVDDSARKLGSLGTDRSRLWSGDNKVGPTWSKNKELVHGPVNASSTAQRLGASTTKNQLLLDLLSTEAATRIRPSSSYDSTPSQRHSPASKGESLNSISKWRYYNSEKASDYENPTDDDEYYDHPPTWFSVDSEPDEVEIEQEMSLESCYAMDISTDISDKICKKSGSQSSRGLDPTISGEAELMSSPGIRCDCYRFIQAFDDECDYQRRVCLNTRHWMEVTTSDSGFLDLCLTSNSYENENGAVNSTDPFNVKAITQQVHQYSSLPYSSSHLLSCY